jgi:hypothetical protein
VRLQLAPISLATAQAFVACVHRHHKPPVGHKFSIGATVGGEIVGVVVVGRPVARALDDGWTLEAVRVATDGTPGACSFLLGAAARASKALGYRRIFSYTLPAEGGASLRGGGWAADGTTPGRSWDVPGRPRKASAQVLGTKIRWVRQLGPTAEGAPPTCDMPDHPQTLDLFGGAS